MIETHQLRHTFRSRRSEVEAVAGVDLSVSEGEIFGFLGPNGAGKTTTLRMLATLLRPSGGEATVAGCDLLRDPAGVRRRIGYVPQGGSADPSVTARAELVLQARLYGSGLAEARSVAARSLEELDLTGVADLVSGTYSGGQRRRLDIALGMVHRPKLLFLDEPTTGLDPQSRAHLWGKVTELRENGTTVFLTTHYLEEADALCDRLAIIDHGRIVAEGSPDLLKREISGDAVRLGVDRPHDAHKVLSELDFVRESSVEGDVVRLYVEDGESALPQLLRVLDRTGLAMRTVSLSRPSLDDVFLRQTGRSLREEQPAGQPAPAPTEPQGVPS